MVSLLLIGKIEYSVETDLTSNRIENRTRQSYENSDARIDAEGGS